MKKNYILLTAAFLSLGTFTSEAALLVITSGSLSPTTNATWLTNGYATLGGNTSGVNWQDSGQQQNSDWTYVGGPDQANYNSLTQSVEWPSALTLHGLGFVYRDFADVPVVLAVGSSMVSDVSSSAYLRISTVAPYAGDYDLNGTTVTGAIYGSVVTWYVAKNDVIVGREMSFTSTATTGNAQVSAGAIGFSASNTIPEPSTWASLIGGTVALIGFQGMRRRRTA